MIFLGLPNEREDQTREVKCVQELSTGIVIKVNEGACLEKKPEVQQPCNCPVQQLSHYRNAHKHHHREKSTQHHSAPITLIGNSTIGKRVHKLQENKKTGIWLASDWNDQVRILLIFIVSSIYTKNVLFAVFNEMW